MPQLRLIICLLCLQTTGALASSATCPDWINHTIPSDAQIHCEELDASQTKPLFGRGLVNQAGRFGFNFHCKDDSCRLLGVLLSDFEMHRIYDITSRALRTQSIGIPLAKNPDDQEALAKNRLKVAFLGLTQSEWNTITHDQFISKMNRRREALSRPASDRSGWNWSAQPEAVSDKKLQRAFESLLRPQAVQWSRYCRYIRRMFKLTTEQASQDDIGTLWVYRTYEECKRTGF